MTNSPNGSSRTGFLYSPLLLQHDTGPGHVERAARLQTIMRHLAQTGLLEQMVHIDPTAADRSKLELAHSPRYLDRAEADSKKGLPYLSSDPSPHHDTRLSPASLTAAATAAGAAVSAVDAVMSGQVQNAFCCIRPPGHHATREAGMGFCIYNSAAVAARWARQRYGVHRVAIVDWDVHHGNGTQDIFYEDGSVFFASSHQQGIYPGTGFAHERGAGDGDGANLNMPMKAHTPEDVFLQTWQRAFLPLVEEYRPELVIVSAGFDSHREDLLGSLEMTEAGFAEMTRMATGVARRHCGGKLVSVLEGGYNVDALAASVDAHLRALME